MSPSRDVILALAPRETGPLRVPSKPGLTFVRDDA